MVQNNLMVEQTKQRRETDKLEQQVQERTEKLQFATRQLAALNEVSNRFSQIYNEDELFEQVPLLLTQSLDFDRANVLLDREGKLFLRAFAMPHDPPEAFESFRRRVESGELPLPPAFLESFRENKTIFIPDLNKDPRWPKAEGEVIRTKAVVISPIKVEKKPIGIVVGNMQHHVREMDSDDVVRFEMFANMVGLALENTRAYQDLERKVIERTRELRDANRVLRDKTRSLEKASYSLANANVQLLAMQEQLEKKNSEIQAIFEAAPVALILSRIQDGKVLFVNQNMADIMGVPIADATSRVTQDYYFDLEDRKRVFKLLAEQGSVSNFELRLKKQDGTLIWATLSVQKAEMGGESVIIGGISDITERKNAEEALRESEGRFRSLVENANDIIYSLTPDGLFSYVSPQWKWILGHEISEVVGGSFKHFVHAEDYPKFLDYFEKIIDTGVRQSGLEYRIQHKNGQWRWHTTNASVLLNDKGQIVSFIGICHDMTLNKKVLTDLADAYRNLRQTQSQLVQSEKMASLGMLVAGIAHEINTPIAAIKSMHDTLIRAVEKINAYMQSRYPEALEDPRLKVVENIVGDSDKVINSGIERVTNIVKRLRSFARLDEADLKTVDIHEGLEDTLSLLHHELKNRITVRREYGNIPQIPVYSGRLNQVFLNILMNARQAIKDTGEITIRTYLQDGKVHIAISDTGGGIPQENIKRLFDPGFTTKGVGVGTGLGLSICYQIVQDHRGEIIVESELGKGSTFTIVLPTNLQVK